MGPTEPAKLSGQISTICFGLSTRDVRVAVAAWLRRGGGRSAVGIERGQRRLEIDQRSGDDAVARCEAPLPGVEDPTLGRTEVVGRAVEAARVRPGDV
jgi:hypothetical protein